jgi:hypothetical protein
LVILDLLEIIGLLVVEAAVMIMHLEMARLDQDLVADLVDLMLEQVVEQLDPQVLVH